jgi:hypothetical protein
VCGIVTTLLMLLGIWLIRQRFFYQTTKIDLPEDVRALHSAAGGSSSAEDECERYGWHRRSIPHPPVYDCFAFNFELDLLEARLHELHDVVDFVVLVEAPVRFSGQPKPMYFKEHAHEPRFAKFLPRIIHVELDYETVLSPEQFNDPVMRKQASKNAIVQGLDRHNAPPDAIVISSDLDELPKRHVVKMLAQCSGYGFPVSLGMPTYNYDFGCRSEWHRIALTPLTRVNHWSRAKVVLRKHLKERCSSEYFPHSVCPDDLRDPQELRLGMGANPLFGGASSIEIEDAGWHLSYFGNKFLDTSIVLNKLNSMSHVDRNTEEHRETLYIQCMIWNCQHLNQLEYGNRLEVPSYSLAPRWIAKQAALGRLPFASWFPIQSQFEQALKQGCVTT